MYSYPLYQIINYWYSFFNKWIYITIRKIKIDPIIKQSILNFADWLISQFIIFDPNNDTGIIGNLRLFHLQIASC
jgi:hypothetical protein